MPNVMPTAKSEVPLILLAEEVENAFVAACDAKAIHGVELRARLTQMVCFWHRLTDAERALVLPHVRNYFPAH